MSDAFDPYHKWLGILPKHQPPHHYRLLGVEVFESDPDVISHAADRQMAHVKSLQAGEYADLSQKLLNEISAAKVCLLNMEDKAAYDKKLKARQKPEKKIATAKPLPKESPVPIKVVQAQAAEPAQKVPLTAAPVASARRYKGRKKGNSLPIIAAVGIGFVVIAGTIFFLTSTNTDKIEVADSSRAVVKPKQGLAEKTQPATEERSTKLTTSDAGHATAENTEPKENARNEDFVQPGMDDIPPASVADEPPLGESTAQQRLPVPEKPAQKTALNFVRDVFKSEIDEAKTSDEKRALAARLLQAALDTEDDPTTKYVLLRVARDVAVSTGDVGLAVEAIEAMAKLYEIEVLESKATTLVKMASTVQSKEGHESLVSNGRTVLRALTADDQYELALELAGAVLASARKTENIALVKEAVANNKELALAASRYDAVKKAMVVMQGNPDDPDANSTVGEYYCIAKGDWEEGLPFLAKGNNAELKAAGQKELEKPSEPSDQVKLGDTWWELAESREKNEKNRLQERAVYWYQQALPELAGGILKSKVEERLASLALVEEPVVKPDATKKPKRAEKQPIVDTAPVDLLKLIDVERHAVHGSWRFEKGTLVSPQDHQARIQIPYSPPAEYALKIRVTRRLGNQDFAMGLVSAKQQFLAILDAWGGRTRGIDIIDGRGSDNNVTTRVGSVLRNGKTSDIVYIVRKNGVRVVCDGHVVVDWRGTPDQLSLRDVWAIPETEHLFIGTYATVYQIHAITLAPISRQDTTEHPGKPAGENRSARVHPVLGYELKGHPRDAVRGGRHWYKFMPGNVTWEEAQRRCEAMGGYLVCIESPAEAVFVARLIRARKFVWLGGFRNERGEWQWVNGKPMTYSNWAPGEPAGGDEIRLESWDGGRWNDFFDRVRPETLGFVCEWEF